MEVWKCYRALQYYVLKKNLRSYEIWRLFGQLQGVYIINTISLYFRHCCQVLGYQLFANAYDVLDQTDDNMQLEVTHISSVSDLSAFSLTDIVLTV